MNDQELQEWCKRHKIPHNEREKYRGRELTKLDRILAIVGSTRKLSAALGVNCSHRWCNVNDVEYRTTLPSKYNERLVLWARENLPVEIVKELMRQIEWCCPTCQRPYSEGKSDGS